LDGEDDSADKEERFHDEDGRGAGASDDEIEGDDEDGAIIISSTTRHTSSTCRDPSYPVPAYIVGLVPSASSFSCSTASSSATSSHQ
jgi:hypothetical protein